MKFQLNRSRAALLLMDFQVDVLNNFPPDHSGVVARTRGLLAAARTAGVQPIHVRVVFRQGYPEISDNNPLFSSVRQASLLGVESAGADFHNELVPGPTEPVVVKHRVGAFSETCLPMLLRAAKIDTLLLCGVATSGVVLSTVMQASDLDFNIVVVEDCCGDPDAALHDTLMRSVLARHASILRSAEVKSEIDLALMPAR